MKSVIRLFAMGAFIAACGISYGWNGAGHAVIAMIARTHLSPEARAEADRLLKAGGTGNMADFVKVASWADDTRTKETGPWHYEDHHFRKDGQRVTNQPDAENAVWAIDKFTKVLADKTKSDAERAEALRYLIHFVGDIHQPLHATAFDSAAHPTGDRGGNDYPVFTNHIFANMDRPPRNLHSLWDMGCGLFINDPAGRTPEGQARIKDFADKLEKLYPKDKLRNEGDQNAEHWALESFEVCKTFVYSTPEGAAPSSSYLEAGRKVSSERAAYAGYRLADLLNKTLK